MQKKLSIRDIVLFGKKVFIRVDFNVPLDKNRNITEDTRIREAIPTIEYALEQGAAVVLASHLGRPDGMKKPEYSLSPVAKRLAELLGKEVKFLDDCIGEGVKKALQAMKPGEVVLLENLRFYAGEEKNDPDFAKQLAEGIDCVVNDAFGTAHRAHASNVGITQYRSPAVAGLLMQKEIEYFGKVLESPDRPVVAILGGAKVSGKIKVINNLLKKVDKLIIGGGMMFTFLKAQGFEIGTSLVENDKLDIAKSVLKQAVEKGVKLYLPVDCIVADQIEVPTVTKTVSVQAMPKELKGLDIGPESLKLFAQALADAKMIIWNGPMGVFEVEAFSKGTIDLAQIVAQSKAISIIGGGDTVSAIDVAGVKDKMSFVSTGGGASLELLEGKELPGIVALTNKSARTPIIAGNWKLNTVAADAKALVQDLLARVKDVAATEIVVCPPFTSLAVVAEALQGSRLELGAQNLYWEKSGAFTGEVSAPMLKAVGCTYVIIGHSERRTYFHETDETVNKKIFAALAEGLKPIVCVGETLAEREKGETFNVIKRQITQGLVKLAPAQMQTVVLAYEPVWAIGTGKTATTEQAQEVHAFIRGLLTDLFGKTTAEATRIQYGGSVNAGNIAALMGQADIDGALVGGASLKADSFEKIVKF